MLNGWVFLMLAAAIAQAGCVSNIQDGPNIAVNSGEQFTIQVQGNPSTGFDWNTTISDEQVVKSLGRETISCGSAIGSGCSFSYKFQAAKPGQAVIRMEYRRPWESRPPFDVKEYNVRVN